MRAGKIAAGVLLALVALTGVGVALSWAPDRPVETLTARWAPSPSQFVPLQGMQVHLRDEGPAKIAAHTTANAQRLFQLPAAVPDAPH